MLLLLSVFALLFVIFLYKFFKSALGGFRHRRRNVMLIVLGFVLATTAYRPYGLIDFESRLAPDALVAVQDGDKGCTRVLKLKMDHTFTQTFTCFSIDVDRGTYIRNDDTIHLLGHPEAYDYAVIKRYSNAGKYFGSLVLYRYKDSPHEIDTATFMITTLKQ